MANYLKLHIRKRITTLFLIVVFIMLGLFGRLIWVQVIHSSYYQKEALDQRLRELKVEPKRGIIYDRNGKELAVSGTAETVVANPAEIEDPEKTAKILAELLVMKEEEVYNRITKDRASVYVKRKIDDEIAAKIKALNLKGITFIEESKRYYPKGELAAHILGFAGIDNQGLDGLELTLDHYLRGVPGRIAVERDATNRSLPNGIQKYFPPENGYNVYLTIDEVIQYLAERELERALTTIKADAGTVIVMNPKTGEILALANRPAYDPNYFTRYSPALWRNIAVSNTYEPGSTFKIITAVTALEEGVVSVNDRFFCKGSIVVAGRTIHCWKDGGHGSQTFAEVVQNSCNPGFVQVGQRIGAETLYKYIDAFGFGKKTGITLPGEAIGIRYALEDIGPVELATISFGHSISVTPIQLITAISAIANDGLLLRPQLVKEVRDSKGNLIKVFKPEPIRQVISKETARLVRQLLSNVVEEGTGKNAQIEGYEIGGKTGTAQHYGDKRAYDSSFIGFVPVDDPKLVILVVLYNVTSYPHFGSQTAAPIFQRVAKNVLRYLEIPPQQKIEKDNKSQVRSKKLEVPDLRNQPIEEAREILLKKGFMVKVEGNKEKVIDQVPKPGAIMEEKSTVILFAEDGMDEMIRYRVTVPDLKGMSVKEAAQLLAELGLRIQYSTNQGKVINQIPAPYTRVDSGTEVKIFVK
ncbi:stage V sporulation protein D [Anoxybacter fermentans]|uniref:Stage V sporulation protein D n=1 Tax=Anoxybacter fermentans TaxID=1323375 RepID=A0A3Q9HQA6_9FIRM|nr:stage V sporulation protein D [Anoxybacter fermentans]AZR73042.1 stage V sporulation protein D [Anoxybacter fermentans]